MSTTPRSGAPSRVGTPLVAPAPSRLTVPPPLRPSPSLSSLQVYSRPATPSHSTSPPQIQLHRPPQIQHNSSSGASTITINVDPAEGILVPEAEADVDTTEAEDVTAIGRVASPAANEDSKKNLREQLRKTLSKRPSGQDLSTRPRRRKIRSTDMNELFHEPMDLYPPREYYVLTEAGKPVFVSRPTDEHSDDLTSGIGLIQALISVFLDDNDKLRCINAGSTRITFLLRSPLYYVAASAWGEPESVTRTHLEYLHLQILSVVSAAHLRKMFERRSNFDLGRLLSGTENILHSLLDRLDWDFALSTSSLHCLRLEGSSRIRIGEMLVPPSKTKDILYVILVANGQVVTLVRPKKHSIHPADLHIIINTIYAPSVLSSPAAVSWLPICLPKFNPNGFVNAYVNFIMRNDSVEGDSERDQERPPSETEAGESESQSQGPSRGSGDMSNSVQSSGNSSSKLSSSTTGPTLDVGLVCISGSGDVEAIRGWCDSAAKKLKADQGSLEAIVKAVRKGATKYAVSELGIPGLRHFIYRSRVHIQITAPMFEDPYDNINERRRLMVLYQTLHDAIHARSGQDGTLKLQYIKTDKENVMGWVTQPFELYIATSPRLPKSAVVGAANAVAKWVKKEESRLFLRDAPVF